MSARSKNNAKEPKIKKKVKKNTEDDEEEEEQQTKRNDDIDNSDTQNNDEEDQTDSEEETTTKKGKKDAKKAKANITMKDNEILIDLNRKKKVSIRKFKNQVLVDFREYFEKNGEEYPTKKGISLTLETWKTLKENIDTIDEAIEGIH